ncbi:hypothetical protein MRS44_013724 [Fusarium solani]|uniref:uncharacterized protein n=1 Tax=Fusarium solani TaxID=169388 RepID=UPI0032C403CE|nr:hypothetical protein MRS44_013724 [Fusarium solani]
MIVAASSAHLLAPALATRHPPHHRVDHGLVVRFIGAGNTFRIFLPDLKAVLAEFTITEDQIGYFVANNVMKNDTCLEDLSSGFNVDRAWRRFRCMGHVNNLVTRALLFGKDPDGFAEDIEEIADDLLRQMKQWRKAGPDERRTQRSESERVRSVQPKRTKEVCGCRRSAMWLRRKRLGWLSGPGRFCVKIWYPMSAHKAPTSTLP